VNQNVIGMWIFRLLGVIFLGVALWSQFVLTPQMRAEMEHLMSLPADSITELRDLPAGSEVAITGQLVDNAIAESDHFNTVAREIVFYELYECEEHRTDEGTRCRWDVLEAHTPDLKLAFDDATIRLNDPSEGHINETWRDGLREAHGFHANQTVTALGEWNGRNTINNPELSSGNRGDLGEVVYDRDFAQNTFLIGMLMGFGMLLAGFQDWLLSLWRSIRGGRRRRY
jgi:hypothetical protein